MFGPRKDEYEGEMIGGVSVMIHQSGDEIIVRARCKITELKYLIQIINERLGSYEEKPAGPARPRLRRHGR